MNGKVKFFNNDKRFGFIIGEDDKDYFVHATDLNEGVDLNEDTKVTFDIVDGQKGPKASNVSLA